MDKQCGEALCRLIVLDSTLIHDAPRLDDLLSDFCTGQHVLERNLLIQCINLGIVDRLAALHSRQPQAAAINQCVRILADQYGMAQENAEWAVEQWSAALQLDGGKKDSQWQTHLEIARLSAMRRNMKNASAKDEKADTYRSAAEQGDAEAQYNLGMLYHYGTDVEQSDALAVEWLSKSAEQGHSQAEHSMAVMYKLGRGVPQSDALAFEWWRRAAEHGLADAQYNTAMMYRDGIGVARNNALAAEWWHKAAEQGSVLAQFNLGGNVQRLAGCA